MHKNDWSLIFFTLLSQLSVGIILSITAMHFCFQPSLQYLQEGLVVNSPQFIALVAIALATIISFLHLGYPAHAFNAVNNLTSSWLSKEILGIGLFGLSTAMIFIQFWMKWDSPVLNGILLTFGSISGLLLIFVMSKIYRVVTIPAWNTWFTPFHFYMSALLLGLMVQIGFLFGDPASLGFVKMALRIIALLLLLQIVAAFLYKNQLQKMDESGIDPPNFKTGTYHTLYLVRLFVIFISAMFAAYLSLKLSSIEVIYNPIIRFYAFVFFLIIVEEVIGRFMFYAGYSRIGV